MATGMKLWLTATITGIALIAAWRLPPSPYAPREARVQPAEVMRAEALNEEVRVTAETLRRVLWSDSLAPLALAEADDGMVFLYPEGSLPNENQVRRWEDRIRSELDRYRATDMVFGYVLQPDLQNQEPGMSPARRDRTELFVGSIGGQEYCLQVRVHDLGRTAWTLARRLAGQDGARPASGALGACRPYLHHGMPGASVHAWLEDGGAALATEHGESEGTAPPWGRRMVFGFSGFGYSFDALEANQCLAGYSDACVDLLRYPARSNPAIARDLKVAQASPATSIGTGFGYRSLLRDEEYLLYDLEQEFGEEAFGRFWTSEADLEAAFEAAFGVPMGEWIVSWVDRSVGIDAPGPGLPRSASTGTTLAIALLAGVAFMRTRKRQVA